MLRSSIPARSLLLGLVLIGSVARGQDERPAKPTAAVETCAECHSELMTRRVTHGPTAQEKCLACHAYEEPREHTFVLTAPTEELCVTCHSVQMKTFAHEPVAQGRCVECHDPHGSGNRMMLRADPARDLCQSCHTQWNAGEMTHIHGPVASGACILCHEAHSSWNPKLLVEPAEDLCFGCHTEMKQSIEESRHVHDPVRKDCTMCHDAHASNEAYQLRENAPGLCFACHGDVKKDIESMPVVHGAVTAEGGCLGCHAAHTSEQPKLQKHGQIETCLGCHDKPIEATDGRMLTNMAKLLKDNPDHHGPIREGACSECHQPHGADHPRLLREAYPPEFYAPFSMERYALCFRCHIPELVTNERGKGLTGFRNGEVNLHWLHVNREKGRTCRACHEVHASRNPFHIRDSVPFGDRGWSLEIKYAQSEMGGSCAPGCHQERSYEREPTPLKAPGGAP